MTSSPERRIPIAAVVVLLGTFAAGTVFGVGLSRAMGPPGGGAAGRGPPWGGGPPFHELGLSDEQQRAVREIMERRRPEIEAAMREVSPKLLAIRDAAKKEVRALLTPEQQRRFDELEARRPAHGPPFGPPFGPPPPPPPDRE